jgi:hypothetical protein
MAPESFHDDTPEAISVCGPEIDAFAANQPAPPPATDRPPRPRSTPRQAFEARWARMDADADGRITFDEFARHQADVYRDAL